jgi:beta-glucanase (GH16 family)
MAIQSPCSPNVVTDNQVTTPYPSDVALPDLNASMLPAPLPIQVTAPGMLNVEVWTHGTLATRLTETSSGLFTGTLDLSKEPAGPLNVRLFAWNSPPGDNSFTVNLSAILDLFVFGHPAQIPFPAAAAGMKLAWSDEFNTLSATACKPGTGVWPNCAPPTATDGFTWFENKPGGGDFGDAAFEHTDSRFNPYQIEAGFLRIRSTYDPNYVDPYGYGRHWYSGLLGSAFNDGTTNVPNLQNGYYEARFLTPNSSSGVPWSGDGGGTWPAFWMLDLGTLQPGAQGTIEEDVSEQYGENQNYTQANQISYGNATGGNWIYRGQPGPDLTADFHRYGLLVTSSTVTFYFDDHPLGSIPKASLPGTPTPNWFLLFDLAMGSGWPDKAPPSNYYDMWIDYVRYYSPQS